MQITDWQRLKEVREGKRTERGCGYTFSACHHAADYLCGVVNESNSGGYAFWVVTHWGMVSYILSMLSRVLQERGVTMKYHRPFVLVGERRLKFVPRQDLECNLRGLYPEAYIIYDS